jgi:hypothetical protein
MKRANASTHAMNKPRSLVFVLHVSGGGGYLFVDMYYHIGATLALLVELYLLQETEFIRFFVCFRQQTEDIETGQTSTVGREDYKQT